MYDWCEGLIGILIIKGVLVGIAVATDRVIVRRRDAIVTRGRRLQNTFNVPHSLWAISDMHPGITEEDLRTAAETYIVGMLITIFIFIAIAGTGNLLTLWGIAIEIGAPTCNVLATWNFLCITRGRLEEGGSQKYIDEENARKQSGTNPGLQRSIQSVASSPAM